MPPFLRAAALCLLSVLLLAARAPGAAAATLDEVRARGVLRCGVSTGVAGFSIADSRGRWTGIDVDFCRALAAAVLGDAGKVDFVPLSAQARFTALQAGEIDILSRNTTVTLSRDASLGLDFTDVWFYDGQGFLISRALGVTRASELDGAAVCTQTGTTTELNLADYFRSHNMSFRPVVFEGFEEALSAFFAERCDVFTADRSTLAAIRAVNARDPDAYLLLPEMISKEPFAAAVRQGDPQWRAIATWLRHALIEAEEKGITAANVARARETARDPVVQRLLGASGDLGAELGLDPDWASRAIAAVGNYGEIFARNVGADSPLGLERGLNALWSEGGLLYALPLR